MSLVSLKLVYFLQETRIGICICFFFWKRIWWSNADCFI